MGRMGERVGKKRRDSGGYKGNAHTTLACVETVNCNRLCDTNLQ